MIGSRGKLFRRLGTGGGTMRTRTERMSCFMHRSGVELLRGYLRPGGLFLGVARHACGGSTVAGRAFC